MARKNDAQYRHAVFTGGQLGVGAEIIGSLPEAGFKLFDISELINGHQ